MNWQALIDRARLLLDDNYEPYLWSEAELTYNAIEAYKEASLRAYLLEDSIGTKSVTLVAGTAIYNLPANILYVERAKLQSSDFYLERTSLFNLERRGDGVNFGSGTPTHYLLDKVGLSVRKITFFPTPNAVDTVDLDVIAAPAIDTGTITVGDEIPIDPLWQDGLTHWMLALAYQKRDGDTFNPQKALEHEALFTQRFGERFSANIIRDRMTRAPMEVITE